MFGTIDTVCVIVGTVIAVAVTNEILFYVFALAWVYALILYKTTKLIGMAFDSVGCDSATRLYIMMTITLHMLFACMVAILAWRIFQNPTLL